MPFKKLPYGNCNFADIMERNFAYVDKTRYIELSENEDSWYQFMLRPRRFGKSLFLSMLDHYYDINRKDRFDALFGGLYIGAHPTPDRGKYAVLSFDFSRVDTENRDAFRESFLSAVRESVNMFLERYRGIFTNANELLQTIREQKPGIDALTFVYRAAALADIPVFILIDEYDNFVNDLMAMNGTYEDEVVKSGLVRSFYKILKSGTSSAVKRIFITGVSPMMVNDLTSGFNIADDLSLLPKYNEMFGFTREEVEWLMDETGIDRKLITVDMESFYNGYMFNNNGHDKVYNSQMILFLFQKILQLGGQPEQLVDANLRTGYDRLHRLTDNGNNRALLLKITMDGGIPGNIVEKFSFNELNSDDNFISLLFYLGMLTCGGTHRGRTWLKVPNQSIRTLYWAYLMRYIQSLDDKKPVRGSDLENVIGQMAFEGEIVSFLDYFTENFLKRLSNRDLIEFDEKYVKVMMLMAFYINGLYGPVSEAENINGYSDIYLQNFPVKPDIKYEYVLEVKYVKTDAAQGEKDKKFAEAFEQIEKYKQDKRFAGRGDLKFAAILFSGKGDYDVREA